MDVDNARMKEGGKMQHRWCELVVGASEEMLTEYMLQERNLGLHTPTGLQRTLILRLKGLRSRDVEVKGNKDSTQ